MAAAVLVGVTLVGLRNGPAAPVVLPAAAIGPAEPVSSVLAGRALARAVVAAAEPLIETPADAAAVLTSFTVRCTDAVGRPVPGAAVRPDGARCGEDAAADAVETDHEGRAVVLLPGASVAAFVASRDAMFGQSEMVLAGETAAIVLTQGAIIDLCVRDEHDELLREPYRVSIACRETGATHAASSVDGRARLVVPGAVTYEGRIDLAARIAEFPVTHAESGRVASVNVRLKAGRDLLVRFLAPDGEPCQRIIARRDSRFAAAGRLAWAAEDGVVTLQGLRGRDGFFVAEPEGGVGYLALRRGAVRGATMIDGVPTITLAEPARLVVALTGRWAAGTVRATLACFGRHAGAQLQQRHVLTRRDARELTFEGLLGGCGFQLEVTRDDGAMARILGALRVGETRRVEPATAGMVSVRVPLVDCRSQPLRYELVEVRIGGVAEHEGRYYELGAPGLTRYRRSDELGVVELAAPAGALVLLKPVGLGMWRNEVQLASWPPDASRSVILHRLVTVRGRLERDDRGCAGSVEARLNDGESGRFLRTVRSGDDGAFAIEVPDGVGLELVGSAEGHSVRKSVELTGDPTDVGVLALEDR